MTADDTMATGSNIAAAVCRVMLKVRHVQKTGRNEHQRYRYASDADLLAAIQPAMADEGLCLMPVEVRTSTVEHSSTKAGKTQFRTDVLMTYLLLHKSGESMRLQAAGCGVDDQDKGVYKAKTGALKYVLRGLFLVPTGDDPEVPRRDEGGGRREAMPPKRTGGRQQDRAADRAMPATRQPAPVRAEPKADRSADAPHHASFAADRARFMASVSAAGISYEKELKPACLAKGWGKPSTWAQRQRDGLVHSLQPGGSGWAKLGLDDPSAGRQPGDESEEIDAGSADDYSAATDAAELRA